MKKYIDKRTLVNGRDTDYDNFIFVDTQNKMTLWNDYYIVWEGTIIPFTSLIPMLGNSDDFIGEAVKTYFFKILQEGVTGDIVKLDKFPMFFIGN